MILQASYNELNGIISDKAQIKGLSLSYCDTDTTKVTFMLNILGLTPSVSVKLKVISIEGSRVTAEVSAGKVGDFVLDKAKKFLMEKTPEGLIESFDDKCAVVNLDAFPELKPVFETITVNGLSFTEEAVCVDATLK
jgi:hypothetical protein